MLVAGRDHEGVPDGIRAYLRWFDTAGARSSLAAASELDKAKEIGAAVWANRENHLIVIDYRPVQGLGHTELPGLVGRHHFCFARYQHPERLDWGRVRIWNEYQLEPGPGRPAEHCDNFDIVTIMRSGVLLRPGSFGDRCLAGAGEAQILTTGSGASIGLRAVGQDGLVPRDLADVRPATPTPRCASEPLPRRDGWHLLASGFDRDDCARLTSSSGSPSPECRRGASCANGSARPAAYLVPISGAVRLGDLMMSEGSGSASSGRDRNHARGSGWSRGDLGGVRARAARRLGRSGSVRDPP